MDKTRTLSKDGNPWLSKDALNRLEKLGYTVGYIGGKNPQVEIISTASTETTNTLHGEPVERCGIFGLYIQKDLISMMQKEGYTIRQAYAVVDRFEPQRTTLNLLFDLTDREKLETWGAGRRQAEMRLAKSGLGQNLQRT